MKYTILISVFFYSCFAKIESNPQSKIVVKSTQRNFQNISILNDNEIYMKAEQKNLFGASDEYITKMNEKTTQILEKRLGWKIVGIYNIHDKNFDINMISTEDNILVTSSHITKFIPFHNAIAIFPLLSYCLIPCHQNVKMNVSVKFFHKSELVAEGNSIMEGKRFISPFYIFVPFLFERFEGHVLDESSLLSSMFLQGFEYSVVDGLNKIPKN
ncbi:hypothetical protein P3G55_00740 [Leptospira sp. 96542]|nr:hypothetical protein [Leptospira sp. 96542]